MYPVWETREESMEHTGPGAVVVQQGKSMKIRNRWWKIYATYGSGIIKESDPTEAPDNTAIESLMESLVKPKPGTTVMSLCNDEGKGWEIISRWEYLGNGNRAGKEI